MEGVILRLNAGEIPREICGGTNRGIAKKVMKKKINNPWGNLWNNPWDLFILVIQINLSGKITDIFCRSTPTCPLWTAEQICVERKYCSRENYRNF